MCSRAPDKESGQDPSYNTCIFAKMLESRELLSYLEQVEVGEKLLDKCVRTLIFVYEGSAW